MIVVRKKKVVRRPKRPTLAKKKGNGPKMAKKKGKGIKKIIGNVGKAFKSAHDFIKGEKLVSKGADIAEILGVPYASTVGKVARVAGYGRGRGRGRPRGGARIKPSPFNIIV